MIMVRRRRELQSYILLLGSKWEKMKMGAAVGMLKDMIKALGGFRKSIQFLKIVKKGGMALDDSMI